MRRHILSKSTFLRGCQCHKALYLYKNKYKLRDPITRQLQAVFRRGTNVGLLAQELFPGGIDCSPPNPFQYRKAVEKTEKAIADGAQTIYEAAFQHEQVLAALDILVKEEGGWVGYEVKSSTSVSEVYELDIALQYHVITGAGLILDDIRILHINGDYVRNGDIELEKLFSSHSLKEEAEEKKPMIAARIEELKEVARVTVEPEIEIGPQCSSPYQCDFTGYCWQDVPAYSVFDIHRLSQEKKFALYRSGIVTIDQVPDDFELSANQALQVACHKENREIIQRDEIAKFVSSLSYPLHFIDFEAFQPAVPLFDQSKPYQQIPFQYSLHVVEQAGAEPVHFEFIARPGSDPRPLFIQRLLDDTESAGTILVYNRSFEAARLAELARDVPGVGTEVAKRLDVLADLMVPFQKKYYYTPAMRGSYSIKKVVPALVSGLDYTSLAIQEGSMASIVYESLQDEEDPALLDRRLDDLLRYCEMDTLAMVEIFRVLQQAQEEGGTVSGPGPSRG